VYWLKYLEHLIKTAVGLGWTMVGLIFGVAQFDEVVRATERVAADETNGFVLAVIDLMPMGYILLLMGTAIYFLGLFGSRFANPPKRVSKEEIINDN